MNSVDNPFPISPEWQKVLDYYLGLTEQWKKEIYLKNLSVEQRRYLGLLVERYEQQYGLEASSILPNDLSTSLESNLPSHIASDTQSDEHLMSHNKYKRDSHISWLKKSIKYVLGGFVTLFITVILLNSASLTNWFGNLPLFEGVFKKDVVLAADQKKDFEIWIGQYKSSDVDLNADADPDQDALSNFEEYQLKTSPVDPDFNKNGSLDGQDLLDAVHPADSHTLNYSDKSIEEQYSKIVPREVLNYRLQSIALKSFQKSLGQQKTNQPTQITQQSGSQVVELPKVISDPVDTSVAARITINKIHQNDIPVAWAKEGTESEFKSLLQSGLATYPGTGSAGQVGNIYIAGLSNDYSLQQGKYSNVLAELDKIEPQDQLELTVQSKDGSKHKYIYVVTTTNIYKPTDSKQFEIRNRSELSISTCWPIGSNDRRLVVRGTLANQELLS